MASADAMERERRRLALLELATQRTNAQQEYQNSLMEARRVGSFSEGTPRPPEPNAGWMDNLKGLGSMVGNTALSFVPGTPQALNLSNTLLTSPEDIPIGVLKSFASTGSNVLDAFPIIDTGEPGNNYANAYRSGEGLSMGLEDILNLLAVGAAGKAANAGATARMGVTPMELFASRVGIKPAVAAEASTMPSRLNALYEFVNNPNRLDAINNLPLPDLSTPPPTFTVKGRDMMSLLDEGYKNMYDTGAISSQDWQGIPYDLKRHAEEIAKFGNEQPRYGFVPGEEYSPYLERSNYGGADITVGEFDGVPITQVDTASIWEVDTRLNRRMTTTPGDSFDVKPSDVKPYDKMNFQNSDAIERRLRSEGIRDKMDGDPMLAYNEVQVYGDTPIPPDDLMRFTLNTVDLNEYKTLGGERSPITFSENINQNIAIAQRLIDEGRGFKLNIRTIDGAAQPATGRLNQFPVIKTLQGQDALDWLISQRKANAGALKYYSELFKKLEDEELMRLQDGSL